MAIAAVIGAPVGLHILRNSSSILVRILRLLLLTIGMRLTTTCATDSNSLRPNEIKHEMSISSLPFKERRLHIISYNSKLSDIRKGEPVHEAYAKSLALLQKSSQVSIHHVGGGVPWLPHLFFNKLIGYLKQLLALQDQEQAAARDPHKAFAIILDSDTIWSVAELDQLWEKFDSVRKQKKIVFSTEINCWIGRMCTPEDIAMYYPTTVEGTSAFVNSGAVMGSVPALVNMLESVMETDEVKTYFTLRETDLSINGSYLKGDQYLLTKYYSNHQEIIALDTSQSLFANFNINHKRTPERLRSKIKRTCKVRPNINAPIKQNCVLVDMRVIGHSGTYTFSENCSLSRNYSKIKDRNARKIVQELSPNPILWHGNGDGKNMYNWVVNEYLTCTTRGYKKVSKKMRSTRQ